MGYDKGEKVVATKNIGGVARELVPKGSRGVVTEAGFFSPTKVLFTIESMFGTKRKIEITVTDDEIA